MHYSIGRLATYLLVTLLFIVSCSKNNDAPPSSAPTTALQNYITSDTALSIFSSAVARAGDQQLFGGSDSITVFIPDNNALRAAGLTQATINALSSGALDSLIKYHIVNGTVILPKGVYTQAQTALGSNLYGYGGNPDNNYFNGTFGSRVSIESSKITVYRISSPLTIPYQTGGAYLGADSSLSFFSAALKRAGIDFSENSGWTTILAPTNGAFRNAGYATVADISLADSATLRNILLYHVLPGQYFTNSYAGLTNIPTSIPGSSINISTGPQGPAFTGNGSAVPIGFAGANQLAGTNTIYQPVTGLLNP